MFRLTDVFVLIPLALVARLLWAAARPTARAPIGRMALEALLLAYLAALGQIVLGFVRLGGLGADFSPWTHVNLVPFGSIADIARAPGAFGQVVGNIVLFMPLGALLPACFARFRRFRAVLLTGLFLSAGIELVQLALLLSLLMDRAADIDDVILNTTGAVLGFAVWAVLAKCAGFMAGWRRADESEA